MAGTREKAEEIVSKLRQVEALPGQGATIADAVRQIGVTQQTVYRWRTLYGGMQRSRLARLKELEKAPQRLRRAVSDLTLDKRILSEAARGHFQALQVAAIASSMCGGSLAYRNAGPAARSGHTGPRHAKCLRAGPVKTA